MTPTIDDFRSLPRYYHAQNTPLQVMMRLYCFVHILLAAEAFQSSSAPRDFYVATPATRRKKQHRRRPTEAACRPTSVGTALNLEPAVIAGSAVAAGATAIWLSGAENRKWRAELAKNEQQEREIQERRAKLAYVEPKDVWSEEELAPYDGSDPDGPILLAVDGIVFNVWKGRSFYGWGGEYHIMAGRDATRLLAKTTLKEEIEEEKNKPLTIAEKAVLEGWFWTFKNKYDVVGQLEGYDRR
mmetsp:Transcript_27330/g.78775  ORF Transcript_27330/g.78775 Transcript_27330/m.78775 type:complete len:242 (-) Transcript_27330:981-1706(-)